MHPKNTANPHARLELVCPVCGITFWRTPSTAVAPVICCSIKCAGAWKRGLHRRAWNYSGRSMTRGYVRITLDDGRRVLEHRHVMEQHLSRPLTADETVHHRDGDKTNNDLSNLMIASRDDHRRIHAHGEDLTRWATGYDRCTFCGRTDRPHGGHGMCRACYTRWYRGTLRPWATSGWSRDHESCVDCGTIERKHWGLGLCSRCYFRHRPK